MPISPDITLYALALSARDATTGWRKQNYTPSTIECACFPHGASGGQHFPGTYAREDAMFFTQDVVNEGDLLYTSDCIYYQAVSVQEYWQLDAFEYREVQAHKMALWQQAPSNTATWQTNPSDPRSRVKTLIDTYANVDHTWIVKDNGTTAASFACIFANPPYPLRLEFRGASNMHCLYVVDQPNSTSLIDDLTRAAYGYEEQVPVHCMSVDSTDCHGDRVRWAMERELRYILETYPTGSIRKLERRGTRDKMLGSMALYDTECTVTWRRDVST